MTTSAKKVLVLYASYGDGHIQVSRALKEQFETQGCDVALVDLFAEAYPKINELTKYLYIKSYTLFPRLYGWSYYSTREMQTDTMFSTWFHSWGISKLKQVLAREKPDAVVNTFPMLAMPELRKKTGVTVPIFNVITDYVLHWRWLHPLVDRYYVATGDLAAEIVATGVPAHRVRATGIPLKAAFQPLERSKALYESHGLDPDKKTVLIMAGSYGVLQGLKKACDSLSALPGVQLIVVCGKNASLYETMRDHIGESENIRLFGFVQQMHELMSLADTMVTKPGGITLTEAIQCGLPVVLLRPVPGQERDNAEYLAGKGAALIAKSEAELIEHIRTLLEPEGKRIAALHSLERLKKPLSAETIVTDILECLASFHTETVVTVERRRVSSERIS
ncbi:glycosyltransferase [Paenibacillus sp. TRM 82003]|nr:glycosyltransferase [Paenibacillus sp. TRM 82003]